jgi:hypothetical protein
MGIATLERTPVNPMRLLRFPLLLCACAYALASLAAEPVSVPVADSPQVLIVMGAEGDADLGGKFRTQVGQWTNACARAGASFEVFGLAFAGAETDREQLRLRIASSPTNGVSPLWIVLVGHGTWDGQDAKFNLRGPDITAAEMAQWLKPVTRPLAVINTASASAPWIPALKGPRRVIISATRSGDEQNYTRFGGFLAEAIADPSGDLDQDGQTSLLEAFLRASTQTAEWYATAGRLATEHPLIDDNADGLGTPAAWFRGTRATKMASGGARPDGAVSHQFVLVQSPWEKQLTPEQRARRDALELELNRLRDRRPEPPNDAYYQKIEAIALELARLQAQPHSAQ